MKKTYTKLALGISALAVFLMPSFIFAADSFTTNPFSASYTSDTSCYRVATYGQSSSHLDATNRATASVKEKMIALSGKTEAELSGRVINLENKEFFDDVNKQFYYWIGAVMPTEINGVTGACPEVSASTSGTNGGGTTTGGTGTAAGTTGGATATSGGTINNDFPGYATAGIPSGLGNPPLGGTVL